ncbi:tetraacyldisaccharide 4'-kinase [soil metagenome]
MSAVRAVARRFWAGELGSAGTVLSLALAPAEAIYRVAAGMRNRAFDRGLLDVVRVSVPVISVGNIAVGGTGKTPFASWLARDLALRAHRPAILHGGYAADEPELHRRWTPDIPVYVEADRSAAAVRAAADGATVLVLDDGFQHRRFQRDLDIVLVAAERWSGSTRLLPRGPWREPLSALRRADVVVVTRKTASAAAAWQTGCAIQELTGQMPVVAHLRPTGWRRAGGEDGGRQAPVEAALLVSGLAEPGLFVENARTAGALLAGELAFADHHSYTQADARRILSMAAGRPIVTTEKDWTKLESWLGDAPVWLLEQQVVMESGDAILMNAISQVLP